MDGAQLVEYVTQIGLTGASIFANVILYRRMDAAEQRFDALQQKRIDEKDALLQTLVAAKED